MIKKLLFLLSAREKKQLLILLPAVVLMGALSAVAVASVLPFLTLLSDPSAIETSPSLSWAYKTFPFEDRTSFLFGLGFGVLCILTLSNSYGALTTWALLRFAAMRNHALSMRLLESYLRRPYSYFLTQNTAILSRNLLAEVSKVVGGVLMQVVQLSARAFVVSFVLMVLLAIHPIMALSVSALFGGLYGAIFLAIRRRVRELGRARLEADRDRFKLAKEMLAGIKEVKLLGLERTFLKHYSTPSHRHAIVNAQVHLMAQTPRFALETLAFGGVLLMLSISTHAGQTLSDALPILGVYAFATYKLLPQLQAIFASVTELRANLAALDVLVEEFDEVARRGSREGSLATPEPLPFERSVTVTGVQFIYPGGNAPALTTIDIHIERGQWVALVGPTGSGKSTLVDILLGLLTPTKGCLSVDGTPIGVSEVARWQRNAGYVPQQIFLADDTIARNVAFGEADEAIDRDRVWAALSVAQMSEFIQRELPDGLETILAERGLRLSGGQRQRVGIARALYRRPKLLVLDEATSALDGETEDSFFRALREAFQDCTVISIAHRLTTTRTFDRIFIVEGGGIVDAGTFEELLGRSRHFASQRKAVPDPGERTGSDEVCDAEVLQPRDCTTVPPFPEANGSG